MFYFSVGTLMHHYYIAGNPIVLPHGLRGYNLSINFVLLRKNLFIVLPFGLDFRVLSSSKGLSRHGTFHKNRGPDELSSCELRHLQTKASISTTLFLHPQIRPSERRGKFK